MGLAACGSQDLDRLPFGSESEHFRFFYEVGWAVDTERNEAHAAWATAFLGVTLPQKIGYYRYVNRQHMGRCTGMYDTNGFANPDRFEVHTLWGFDNHEPIHVYSALIGRPSDFFNEGLAVALSTDPREERFEAAFNGQLVHVWARQRLEDGTLLPLDGIIVSSDFRALQDTTFSYREAGAFVRYLIDTYGVPPFAEFMRRSSRDDSRATIRTRFADVFASSLAASESRWHEFLRKEPQPSPAFGLLLPDDVRPPLD